MWEDLKIFSFICVAAVISAVIRFKTLIQMIIDSLLGFLAGISSYKLLGLWIVDGDIRAGIVGIIIMYCRPLYDWTNSFIQNNLTKLIFHKIGDRNDRINME